MLLLTTFLVLLTGIYAWLTYRMLEASREAVLVSRESVAAMREQTAALYRPYVSVSTFVAPEARIVFLRIANTGRAAAENLRLELDRDFQVAPGQPSEFNLRKVDVFTRPIAFFPPGAEFVFLLGFHKDLYGEAGRVEHPSSPHKFNIQAQYSFFGGAAVTEVTPIDLGLYWLSMPPYDGYIRALRSIRTGLKPIERAVGTIARKTSSRRDRESQQHRPS